MGTRLFVGNLSYAVTEQELREAFAAEGIEVRSVRVALDQVLNYLHEQDIDTLARSDSLAELERRDPRQAQVVQLRFFGGFMMAEIADYLNVSCGTAKYDL